MTQANLWQSLEHLRPSLPGHIHIQRRNYRDELWYVLHDKSNGRFHRLSPSAYCLIGFMNGRNNLQQILTAAAQPGLKQAADEAPTQQEFIELLQYLHVADLLICDMPPDTRELFARQQQKKRQGWLRLLVNPLTWKIPLGDPDKLLTYLLPLARLLASPLMGVIWLLVVGYALLQAGNHWTELTSGQLDSLLSPANLLLLWLTYPLLKFLHELGHGLFTKAWGGDVHECGVVVVLGTPLPYVDATAATAFAQKPRRLMVSAAGMAVELFLAAIALLIWLNIEAGLVRDILYNIIIVGSVSTLFFNGNPLLRFDGYHLLCDAIDMPNLATRANQHITYCVQRYGYGVQGLHSPAVTRGEAGGLVIYGLAAFLYRLLILVVIILMVAKHFPAVALILAGWLVFFQLFLPAVKQLFFLFTSKKLAATRRRSVGVTLGSLGLATLIFFYLPVPMSTAAEGVLWLPDDARVRAGSAGQVIEVFVKDGAQVTEGQALVQLNNPRLISELIFQQAALKEYQARYRQAWTSDHAQAQLFAEDIRAIGAEIEHLQMRVDNLLVRSPSAGYFAVSERSQWLGRYLHQGDTLGLIVKDEHPRIRAALTQQEIGLVRQSTLDVEVRLAGDIGHVMQGSITREVPAGTFTLPSPVLGTSGGGRLALDAKQPDGTRADQLVFLVDVSLPDLQQGNRYGERAYILFRHPAQPLAVQVYRVARQLFLTTVQG